MTKFNCGFVPDQPQNSFGYSMSPLFTHTRVLNSTVLLLATTIDLTILFTLQTDSYHLLREAAHSLRLISRESCS